MRWIPVCAVLAVAATTATAGPCELTLDLHGALVDARFEDHLVASTAATSLDYELPAGARLVGFALRGKHGAGAAVVVPADAAVDEVRDDSVLGADPALVTTLPDSDAGRPRFRAIVEPIADGSDLVAVARWTAIADIRDGELRVVLPARAAGACKATIHAQAGAGASVTRIRVGAAETRGAVASFALDGRDVPLAVELAFARPEPLAWVQREPLGDGTTAEAVTVLAPPTSTLARVHRALLVVDTSRSMAFVGGARVTAAIHAIVEALPPGSQLQAIAFDRAPVVMFDSWKPAGTEALAELDRRLAARASGNGSDLAAALVLAHNTLPQVATKDPTLVVAITDGALGDADPAALSRALGDPRAIDLHVIALDFADHAVPSGAALVGAVDRAGGSYVELPADDVARAAAWLEPAWFGLVATGAAIDAPAQVRAGEGFVRIAVTRAPHAVSLVAHDEDGQVAFAAHALAATEVALLSGKRPQVDASHALAVLATTGKVARDRHAMVAGGGPFTRMIAVADPPAERVAKPPPPPRRAPGLDRDLLQKLFELQLQPSAYKCYQHALAAQVAANKPPTLAGTARFSLELARGEVTHAAVNGLGDAGLDACLLDAAYALVPPAPNADLDADDRTRATYPLTFVLRSGDKPFVVAGDADSSSPLDIESIRGGVETSTPLGPLRPSP